MSGRLGLLRELFSIGRFRRTLTLGLLALGLIATGVALAASGSKWKVQPSTDPGGTTRNNALVGVAATSASNAWAVGYYANGTTDQTLIERWNGKNWKTQKSPHPSGTDEYNDLSGVAATSAKNAWAVGYYYIGTADQTLITRWNGKTWKTQKSPDPGGASNENSLAGVTATSPKNAWAVGNYYDGTAYQTLIARWNGKAWKTQKSPNPGGSSDENDLLDVAATSPENAWAVGDYYNGTIDQRVIERWNGKTWKTQKSPNPGASGDGTAFLGVTATSAKNAWAVGYYANGTADQTLIEHWNGKTWKTQRSPNPGGASHDNVLLSVVATSPTNAWAVGFYSTGSAYKAVIEHWNGKTWKTQKAPKTDLDNTLFAVTATASNNAWAVGFSKHTAFQTRILHRGP